MAFSLFNGVVVSEKTYSSTTVFSSGGGGYVGPQGGHVHAPTVSSQSTTHEEFFVKEDCGGREQRVHWRNGNIGVRVGHRVTLIYKLDRLVGVFVHDTKRVATDLPTHTGKAALMALIGLLALVAEDWNQRLVGVGLVASGAIIASIGVSNSMKLVRILRDLHAGREPAEVSSGSRGSAVTHGATPQPKRELPATARSAVAIPAVAKRGAQPIWLRALIGCAALAGLCGLLWLGATQRLSRTQIESSAAAPIDPAHALPELVQYSYRALLSVADHLNSNGKPIGSAVAVLIQDRVNYHRKLHRDREDQADPQLMEREARRALSVMLQASMQARVARQILEGAPEVEVRVYKTRAEVAIRSTDLDRRAGDGL